MLAFSWESLGASIFAIGMGAYGIWNKWGKAYKEYIKNKKVKQEVLTNARIFSSMYALCRAWRSRKGAMRVLLLYARNSGKPWRPTDSIKVWNLLQAVEENTEDTSKRWQEWTIDPPYRETLSDLLHAMEHNMPLLLTTSTLPKSELRDAYLQQGTIASVVFGIKWMEEENALLYASINFGRESDFLSEKEKDDYESQAAALVSNPEKIRRMIAEAQQIWKNVR